MSGVKRQLVVYRSLQEYFDCHFVFDSEELAYRSDHAELFPHKFSGPKHDQVCAVVEARRDVEFEVGIGAIHVHGAYEFCLVFGAAVQKMELARRLGRRSVLSLRAG